MPSVVDNPHHLDEFEQHAVSVLDPKDHDRLSQLFLTRRQFMSEKESGEISTLSVSAEALKAKHSAFLRHAAEILGKAGFERVFQVPADEDFAIVDSEIYERERNREQEQERAQSAETASK